MTCAAALFAGSAVQAEEVLLTSTDGSIEMRGELIDFDGRNFRIRSIIGEMVVSALQVTCQGSACPQEGELAADFGISGATDLMEGLLPALLEDYSFGIDAELTRMVGDGQQQEVQLADAGGQILASVNLRSTDSASGLNDILAERALLAVTDRAASQDEINRFSRAGLGNPTAQGQEILLALDGLLVVVSRANPVGAISQEDIARVFSGQITNWAQLGGPDQAIKLYARSPDSGTGSVFDELVMSAQGLRMAQSATILDTDRDVSDAVAGDPFGIGISSFSNARNAKVLDIRGACGILTPATPFTIKTEEYPLSRRLLMYKPNVRVSAQVDSFIDYIASEDAQNIIADGGFVDQGVSLLSSRDQGLRFASAMLPTDADTSLRELGDMVQQLLPAERVSLTFRFALGSSELDARAVRDIQRLADLIAGGEQFANKELLLVGFTDAIGDAGRNRALSFQRAAQVQQALESVAIPGSLDTTPISLLGFGEASPLSCNETAGGRQINRRVEVWVREIVR